MAIKEVLIASLMLPLILVHSKALFQFPSGSDCYEINTPEFIMVSCLGGANSFRLKNKEDNGFGLVHELVNDQENEGIEGEKQLPSISPVATATTTFPSKTTTEEFSTMPILSTQSIVEGTTIGIISDATIPMLDELENLDDREAIRTEDLWRLDALPDQQKLVDSSKSCRTSKTNRGYLDQGKLDAPCKFPFILKGKTYYECTYDFSHITGYFPWCSTNTDENNHHISGEQSWGICDDYERCNIPPRLCGEPIRTRPQLENFEVDETVEIEQMPWMASLGTYESVNQWKHQCGGSLVTNKHVLTAAHCFAYLDPDNLATSGYKMRLGTSDLWNAHDGIERNVVAIYVHPKYSDSRAYFDVGVAVAERIIEFTDTVMPVCLPMQPIDDEDALAGDYVNLAGWGLRYNTSSKLYQVSSNMKLASLQVNSREVCEKIFSDEAIMAADLPLIQLRKQIPKGFTNDISCVGNDFSIAEGSCDGDSGSPIIKRISGTARKKPFYEQHFIVSTGIDCKLKATIFTRVTSRQVLNWIQNVTDTTPLLMVIGGFSDIKNSVTNDIELIGTKDNRACSKFVKPFFGDCFEGYYDDYAYEYVEGQCQGEMLGLTGQFTNEVPIFCGGKNLFDNLNTCYEFDYTKNEWFPIPTMGEKRYLSSSVLDERGNLWVLGGTDNSENADSTEVYEYRPAPEMGKWRKGYPLPAQLRDTGIESQCTVRVNSTHVFMAGGYAAAYRFCDPLKSSGNDEFDNVDISNSTNPRSRESQLEQSLNTLRACDDEELSSDNTLLGGGNVLANAWVYDGLAWIDLPPMSMPRERHACSQVQLEDGTVQIIVAGGCTDWCSFNPPVSSAEMYNPLTNTWTQIADLPEPLSSVKMNQLGGLPTIVGGYNGETQNGLLYQYHASLDEWIPLDGISMRVPRTSAAVFQVPKHLFPNC